MARLGSKLVACAMAAVVFGLSAEALAAGHPILQYVYGGNTGQTVVFIHGKGDCEAGAVDTSNGSFSACAGNPAAYWTNSWNGATMLNESTIKYTSSGASYYEAFAIGHDTESQGYWSSYADVAYCLRDLIAGSNNSGCNPNGYQRSYFHLVAHSAGAAMLDRIVSAGWFNDITPHIQGYIISDQGALAGARSASALYGVDGQGNVATAFVSWLAGMLGMGLKSNGAWSLTRGNVIQEAQWGHQGKSPIWFLKVTTTGGSCSANNSGSCGEFWCGTGVNESDNDCQLGASAAAVGYSSDDDTDGILWMYDTDPSSNPGGNNGGKYNGNYTGMYWHWFSSWANHSHGRNDAYTTKGYWGSSSGCYTISPGTCFAQYGM